MTVFQLFLSFFQIGAFSFGGGYAALALIQEQVVELHGWLSAKEFTDLVTISQMTPGPIAINAATFVGMKTAGIYGAAAATLGCILPSCILVSAIARIYVKYRSVSVIQGILHSLRPAVVSMIASAGLSILLSALFKETNAGTVLPDFSAVFIFIAAVFLLRKKKMNPVLVMLTAGVMKIILCYGYKVLGK